MIKLILMSAFIFNFAFAGGDRVGNGGDAVKCGMTVNLLDYWEYFMLAEKLAPLSEFEHSMTYSEMVADFIARLSRVNKAEAMNLEASYNEIKSKIYFAMPGSLPNLNDDWVKTEHYGLCHRRQLAIFYPGEKLHIDMQLWNLMDEYSKAGLLIHEALYLKYRTQYPNRPVNGVNVIREHVKLLFELY